MKRFLNRRNIVIAVTVSMLALFIFLRPGEARPTSPFETAPISRGDIVAQISATGALSAVGTVEVGTQVSGTVDRVLVDYNDKVSAGQLLAVLDTVGLAASVRDAQAGVQRAEAGRRQADAEVDRARSQVTLSEAQRDQADSVMSRKQQLFGSGTVTSEELGTARLQAATAAASVQSSRAQVASAIAGIASAGANLSSAQASLAQAQRNRRNAEIRAPIPGLVIQRSVDAGQTVAASFSTPTLFVIARGLNAMEILAQVDEGDVGLVRPGQNVRFTVAAYPDRTFDGVVRQRRLQPETVQNVVHYTVVIEAVNQDNLLLPGMTANVKFIVDRVDGALLVPAAALRYQPADELRLRARAEQRGGKTPGRTDSIGAEPPQTVYSPDTGEIWIPIAGGQVKPVLVRVRATDGAQSAISPLSPGDTLVKVGLEVITRAVPTRQPPVGR